MEFDLENWPVCEYCGQYIDEPKPGIKFCSDHCKRKKKMSEFTIGIITTNEKCPFLIKNRNEAFFRCGVDGYDDLEPTKNVQCNANNCIYIEEEENG